MADDITTSSSVDKAADTQAQTAPVTPKAATPIPVTPPPIPQPINTSSATPMAESGDTETSGIQPGYKIITNLQPCQQHIPLSDGTGIDLGPYLSPTRSSAPILGKLLNKDFMKRMVHLKRLRID